MLAKGHGQILTEQTALMNVRAWTDGLTERIGDSTARTIASWYHSPSPRDEHITRLSHGMNFSTTAIVDELQRTMREMGEAADIQALIHWVETF